MVPHSAASESASHQLLQPLTAPFYRVRFILLHGKGVISSVILPAHLRLADTEVDEIEVVN